MGLSALPSACCSTTGAGSSSSSDWDDCICDPGEVGRYLDHESEDLDLDLDIDLEGDRL